MTEELATEETEAEVIETETTETETETDISGDEETEVEEVAEPQDEPEKESGVQKRIDKLTRKRREAETDAAYWRGRAEGFQTPPEQEEIEDDGDDVVYTKADIKAEVAKELALEKQSSSDRTRAENANKQLERGRELFEDFDEVAIDTNVIKSMDVLEAVEATGDDMPTILHYLGGHQKEAANLHGLSPIKLGMAMAKLQAKATTKPKPQKKITTAPDPHKLKIGSNAVSNVDVNKMSQEDQRAKWQADRRARRGIK